MSNSPEQKSNLPEWLTDIDGNVLPPQKLKEEAAAQLKGVRISLGRPVRRAATAAVRNTREYGVKVAGGMAVVGLAIVATGAPGEAHTEEEANTAMRAAYARIYAGQTPAERFRSTYIAPTILSYPTHEPGRGLLGWIADRPRFQQKIGQNCLVNSSYDTAASHNGAKPRSAARTQVNGDQLQVYPVNQTVPLTFTISNKQLIPNDISAQVLHNYNCAPVAPVETGGP